MSTFPISSQTLSVCLYIHTPLTRDPSSPIPSHLDPKDASPPTSTPATCQAAYQYLYCIPGTSTYIFFGTLNPSLQPPTSYATALNSSIEFIDQYIGASGDGPIAAGQQYLATPATDVEIFAEDAGGHRLTWGVLGVALQGLDAWMAGKGNGYSDATFQINDGRNEVGVGYVGAVDGDGVCVFAGAAVPDTACVAVDEKGEVYGSHEGVIC